MLGLKLNHVSKRGHRWHSTHCVPEANSDSNAVWFVCNCKGKDMCLNCPCNNVVFLYIDICSCLGCTAFCRDVFAFTSFVCTRKVAKHIVHTNMCRSVPQLTYQIYDNLGYSVILLSDSLTFAVHPRYSVYIVWMPSIKGIHRIFSLGIYLHWWSPRHCNETKWLYHTINILYRDGIVTQGCKKWFAEYWVWCLHVTWTSLFTVPIWVPLFFVRYTHVNISIHNEVFSGSIR